MESSAPQVVLYKSGAAVGWIEGFKAISDLVNWIPIQTNSPFTGPDHYVDPAGTPWPARFYKVLIGP